MAFSRYEPIDPLWPLFPDEYWLAPSIGDPTLVDTAAEPRDKWYERQRLSLFTDDALPAVDGETAIAANAEKVAWNPAAEDWGGLTHIAIMGGKRHYAFTTVLGYLTVEGAALGGKIAQSDKLEIPIGGVSVTIERIAGENRAIFNGGTVKPVIFHNFFREGGTLTHGDYTDPEDLTPEEITAGRLMAGPNASLMAGPNQYLLARRFV